MKAHELLATSDKWTQGAFAKDKEGRCVSEYSEEAACWCILGAIEKCYETLMDKIVAKDILAQEIEPDKVIDTNEVIVQWNDAKDRTHSEVLAKLKELDI